LAAREVADEGVAAKGDSAAARAALVLTALLALHAALLDALLAAAECQTGR
jgi:hypothetical protein